MANEKQYGLILPKAKKQKTVPISRSNPIQDLDDELENDSEQPLDWVAASLKSSAGNAGQRSLQKRLMKEALEEDASIFQYDEVYDGMQSKKVETEQQKKSSASKKPKYIENILKTAQKRKIENERRIEKTVQKEREAEGDKFSDKEAFITDSYRKKLDELKKAEFEEKCMKIQEEKDMKNKNEGAFYNHLFKQKMGEVEVKKEPQEIIQPTSSATTFKSVNQKKKNYRSQNDCDDSVDRVLSKEIKTERPSPSPERNSRNSRRHRAHSRSQSNDRHRSTSISPNRSRDVARKNKSNSSKSYDKSGRRHRSRSKSQSNDRSRDRSRSKSKESNRRRSRSRSKGRKRLIKSPNRRDQTTKNRKSSDSSSDSSTSPSKEKENENTEEDKKVTPEPESRLQVIQRLFTKRTMGENFDIAVQMYFERKAARENRNA